MANIKTAMITGITGQDGAYLAELLLGKGYVVTGCYRPTSTLDLWRLERLGIRSHPNLKLRPLDLLDPFACLAIVTENKFDEIYNLAAQSFVGASFSQPLMTSSINGHGTLHLLEAIRIGSPDSRFYQASTSEMFGKVLEVPQTENTPFYPRSPYGVAKLYAHWMTINYREAYGLNLSCGILFNHESPLRGMEFVTRKITSTVASIKRNGDGVLYLGNLDAERDWGFAKEYVKGMWQMLQADVPDDYVLASGKTTSVRRFVETAFQAADIDIAFEGKGLNEVGRDAKTGKTLVQVKEEFFRPAEVDQLLGSAQKAKQKLGWEAVTSVDALARLMVEADLTHSRRSGYGACR